MDEKRRSWTHFGLISEQAYKVVECSLRALNELEVPYVLVGGWAVACYGSPVPSVDTDIYAHREDRARIVHAVEESCGFAVNESDTLELLDWDAPTSVLTFDLDLGRPELAFLPMELFSERPPTRRPLAVTGRAIGEAAVPDPSTLLFLKLCAWRSRRFRWEALRDPSVLARMESSDKFATYSKTPLHWERKAGKDLYDAAWILHAGAALDETFAIAARWGLEQALRRSLTDIPELLAAYALDLVRDDGIDDVVRDGIAALERS